MSVIVIRALFNEPFSLLAASAVFTRRQRTRNKLPAKDTRIERKMSSHSINTISNMHFSFRHGPFRKSDELCIYFYVLFSRASLSLTLASLFIKITIGMLCMQWKSSALTWISHQKKTKREANTTEEVKLSSVSRIRPAWCMGDSRLPIQKSEFNICENLSRGNFASLESPKKAKMPRQSINVNKENEKTDLLNLISQWTVPQKARRTVPILPNIDISRQAIYTMELPGNNFE